MALHNVGSFLFTASVVVPSAFGRPATIEKKAVHSTSIHFGGASGWRIDESTQSTNNVGKVRIQACTPYVVCYTTVFGVGLDITETKNMAIKPDFTLRELAVVFGEAKVVVFKSLENITKVLVMLIFPLSKHYDVN